MFINERLRIISVIFHILILDGKNKILFKIFADSQRLF